MNIFKRIGRELCLLTSRLKWQGFLHPLWITYDPKLYGLNGYKISRIMELIDFGDIIITRSDGYFSTYMLPGFWVHGGICTSFCYRGGWLTPGVTHSTAKGVCEDLALDFLHADHAIILRAKDNLLARQAVVVAGEVLGAEYDFSFDFDSSKKFACTEFVMFCYAGILKPIRRFWGKNIMLGDDIVAYTEGDDAPFTVIYDSREATNDI